MQDHEFQMMLNLAGDHWWWRGRLAVVLAEIEKLPLSRPVQVLDAGCGVGSMLDELAGYGHIAGFDVNPEAVEVTRARGHEEVLVGSLDAIPFEDGRFDLITCLDVVEHLPNDTAALSELRRVTRPGGYVIVAVPAYEAMWSQHDVACQHYRRYRSATLRRACELAGWTYLRDTYFMSLLFPPAAVVRFTDRLRGRVAPDGKSDFERTPPALNKPLAGVLKLEAKAVARGRRLPAGLSLLAVLQNDGAR
jgi:SAM-dependent methyltransferase